MAAVVRSACAEKPFVWSANNVEALNTLNKLGREICTLLLHGPKGCGKTTLLRSLVVQAAGGREDRQPPALFCSAVEIHVAVFVRENERFLEKLGKASFVAIDDIDLLMNTVEGDSLLQLLLRERDRGGLPTVLSSGRALEDLRGYFGGIDLGNDKVAELDCLDFEGKIDFARSAAAFYGTKESPKIGENSFHYLASQFDVVDIDLMIRFFMTESDYRFGDIAMPEAFVELRKQNEGDTK